MYNGIPHGLLYLFDIRMKVYTGHLLQVTHFVHCNTWSLLIGNIGHRECSRALYSSDLLSTFLAYKQPSFTERKFCKRCTRLFDRFPNINAVLTRPLRFINTE
jgi:hypothetical protein